MTFVRRTAVTFARSPFPNGTASTALSEASHATKTFFFLAASLLKLKKLQVAPGKVVVSDEADGSDLCVADRG